MRDLPNAELHLLDTGHFALEEELEFIARTMRRFLNENVSSPARGLDLSFGRQTSERGERRDHSRLQAYDPPR